MSSTSLKYEGGNITVGIAGAHFADFVCDGVDDDVQIQAAIDEASARGGGVVEVLGGVYNPKTSIALKDNVHLLSFAYATLEAPTDAGNELSGTINVSDKKDVTIEGFSFEISGNWTAITSYGHENLRVLKNKFTGTSGATGCVIHLCGQTGSGISSMKRTLIENNEFVDIDAKKKGTIRIYPRDGRVAHDVVIKNNRFERAFGKSIFLDAYDELHDVKILGNTFVDLLGNATDTNYAVAIHGGLNGGYYIKNVVIQGNTYTNDLTATDQPGIRYSFAQLYICENILIEGNVARGGCAPGNTAGGMFYAPGRVGNPTKNVIITNNVISKFDALGDFDACEGLIISNNYVKSMFHPTAATASPLWIGYDVQKYVRIHDNVFICDVEASPLEKNSGAITLGASPAPIDCAIYNNLIVDTRVTPAIKHGIIARGVSGFDFSRVDIWNNKIVIENGTLTSDYWEEAVGIIPPNYT